MKRVTADLDYGKFKAWLVVTKAIFLKKYDWYSFELRKSPSHKKKKKGFHLIVWFKGNVPVMKLRKYFSDDKNRLKIDRMRRLNKQFLFRKKKLIKLKGGAKKCLII